jgi:hypothetical protein
MCLPRARLLTVLPFLLLALPAGAAYVENWNDAGAADDDWFWFQDGYSGEDHAGDHPLNYSATGGVTGGHAATPLTSVTEWSEAPSAHDRFFAYTWVQYHAIDLAVDPYINAAFKDQGGLNLHGGEIRFWIGQWNDADDNAFFAFAAPFLVGSNDWSYNQVSINRHDWTVLTQGASSSVTSAEELFTNPQQWGFMITGGSAAGDGVIGIDDVSTEAPQSTPLPGTLLLLAPAVALLRRRR